MLEPYYSLIIRRWPVAKNDEIFLVITDLTSQENSISLFSRLMQRHVSNPTEFETCAGAMSTSKTGNGRVAGTKKQVVCFILFFIRQRMDELVADIVKAFSFQVVHKNCCEDTCLDLGNMSLSAKFAKGAMYVVEATCYMYAQRSMLFLEVVQKP